jgi:hypothetical protein
MNRRRAIRTCLTGLLLLSVSVTALAQDNARIVEWVEDAPVTDASRIALGYPVPIPVDTPLPFDGFRTYNGLHTRHLDLAATTPWVHAEEVGTTRQGRTIWMYRLGDEDLETAGGFPEHAMLSNGGIHAREWQSPEAATGIMELIATSPDDDPLIGYLRENANIMVIPVLNVDGFLQTQRYPRHNWLGTDPDDPDESPRDGRMRRKNMLGVLDDDLVTAEDHLLGVDLNRNNAPYWASNPRRSSNNPASIVHHGASQASEPEIQALDAAAQFGPANKLSMYTDMHSFSQVHFWSRNPNIRLTNLTETLLRTFSTFHSAFPAGKFYGYNTAGNIPVSQGIGTTDEYFTHTYQVPSWTLEIEPTGNTGADYGGYARNGHDGFILPESEVERVRTELAQTFAVAYYRQAGPPSITALRITDSSTGATVFEAEWDAVSATERQLHQLQVQPLQLGRDYRVWIAWDKPMRWRENGDVVPLPGQPEFTLDFEGDMTTADGSIEIELIDGAWLDQPGGSPFGYRRYRDDAVALDVRLLDTPANRELVQAGVEATLHLDTYDMTGNRGDANPATVARWFNGAWSGYESTEGVDGNDQGGSDSTIKVNVTADLVEDPFVVEPGISGAWFDTSRNGEGFILEILEDGQAVMYWFTYDGEGRQDWYIAVGEVSGNRILFPDLLRVSGGQFGPDFDPGKVVRTPVGSADFIFASCDSGAMNWVIDRDGGARRQGRMDLTRLSRVMGVDCGPPLGAPILEIATRNGSWYDPSHSGEGYTLEILLGGNALVYWFSFDPEGNRRWFFGTGELVEGTLVFDDMLTTSGPTFGADYDPASLVVSPWGSLQLLLDCSTGTAEFEPTEEGFPAGTLDLDRLTALADLKCGP